MSKRCGEFLGPFRCQRYVNHEGACKFDSKSSPLTYTESEVAQAVAEAGMLALESAALIADKALLCGNREIARVPSDIRALTTPAMLAARERIVASAIKTPTGAFTKEVRDMVLIPANCRVPGHFKFQENGGHCMMCQEREEIEQKARQPLERALLIIKAYHLDGRRGLPHGHGCGICDGLAALSQAARNDAAAAWDNTIDTLVQEEAESSVCLDNGEIGTHVCESPDDLDALNVPIVHFPNPPALSIVPPAPNNAPSTVTIENVTFWPPAKEGEK